MTVNYFIKCPICGAVTRMRSPAGYIYSTPVRIHCGSCNTLLSGEFISDNEKIKAYYKPFNCESISTREYDYYGEASGELLCAKIIPQKSNVEETLMPRPSPVFAFMSAMGEEEREAYINYACYASDWSKNIDNNRVKYDLYLNKKYELLKSKYENIALQNGYDLSSSVYQYIYYSMFYDCGGIFKKSDIVEILRDINCHFYHLDKTSLNVYLELLEKDNRIERAENKLYTAFLEFQKIAPNLMPAVAVTYYEHPENIDKAVEGLTTCTFEDISHFYQDTFEVLAEFCDIVIGLDNIENRNGFDVFPNKLNMEKLREQKKGNRIKFLNATEFFANYFNLDSGSNDLRNAIGHKNYSYNGITQEIVYAPKETSSEMSSKYLIEVALECVSLMKSVYVLLFYVYELKRYLFLKNGEGSFLHPLFYKRIKSQNHCACGSGKKYRDCCKKTIEKKGRTINQKKYPQKASMDFPII